MLINALAGELTALLEMWIHTATTAVNRKLNHGALSKIKVIYTIIIKNNAPYGNANYVREESENGGEQEAAIPLTGGFVRSVMVRVQLLFTDFCRRGRHVFESWSNLHKPDKKLVDLNVVSP